jgi:hypothetical protein
MPRSVRATLTIAERGQYPFNTPTPASYLFSLNDGVSTPIALPYGGSGALVVTFPAVPAGTWSGSARMQLPDGTLIGPTATGQVTVLPDDVPLNEPVTLALAVA